MLHGWIQVRLIGKSEPIERVRRQIGCAASVDSTVLVTGESGTGKELTARTIHELSGRTGRLVPLNCAAIPDSLLESELFGYERGAFTGAFRAETGKLAQANSGTLFLDEVGELSSAGQAKLLRAIELKEVQPLGGRKPFKVDVRIVAATNRSLEDLIAERRFREDLYYRLNVVVIHMAPLRELTDDLPLLVEHCLADLNARFHQDVRGVDHNVQQKIARYRWPGNVRELRNMLEATCVGRPGPTIHFEHLPEMYQRRFTETCEAPGALSERQRLLHALNATHWNKSKAAAQLRWSRVTLYRKLAQYGISNPDEER
jgi:transcriptional regulator with PAS, ATPase and Fis domain